MEVSVATKDVKEQEEDENELDIVEKEKGEVLPQEAEPQGDFLGALEEKLMVREQESKSTGDMDYREDLEVLEDDGEDEKGAEVDRMNEEKAKAISFWEEFMRLSRGMRAAQLKQKQLLEKCRQVQEELFSNAIQFQVATQAKQQEETSLSVLRLHIENSRIEANKARHKNMEASKEVTNLKREIDRLKTLLKGAGITTMKSQSSDKGLEKEKQQEKEAHSERYTWEALYKDSLVESAGSDPLTYPEGELVHPITPFQEWKITNSFWTPDTPAASFFAHREVFDPYYYEGILPEKTSRAQSLRGLNAHRRRASLRSEELLHGSAEQLHSRAIGKVSGPHTRDRGKIQEGREMKQKHKNSFMASRERPKAFLDR